LNFFIVLLAAFVKKELANAYALDFLSISFLIGAILLNKTPNYHLKYDLIIP